MQIPGQVNVFEHGVHLPTGGHWVDLPGSPFQLMTRASDILGTVHIRIRPAYGAYWNEFMSTKEIEPGRLPPSTLPPTVVIVDAV